jgi:hypothetical protein
MHVFGADILLQTQIIDFQLLRDNTFVVIALKGSLIPLHVS